MTINGTAVLNTQAASAQIGDLTVNGGVLSGTAAFGSGSFGFNGAVLVNQDATFSAEAMTVAASSAGFNVAAGRTLTVDGSFADTFSGQSALTKLGAGIMILTGANAQTGLITVSAGTLQVGDNTTTGELSGLDFFSVAPAVTNDGSLVIKRSNAYALANDISGAGQLIQAGTGKTELTGTNTYTGVTIIQDGALKIDAASRLGSSSDTVATNLLFKGGALEYTDDTVAFTRAFTVENGGAGFLADGNMAVSIGDGLVSQLDFHDAAASNRVLTLGGLGTADHTFAPVVSDLTDAAAGRAFSSIVKDGVGKWIIASSGDAVNADATVEINAGILGFTAGALGGGSHTGTVTLGDQTTLRWESGNTNDLSARLRADAGATTVALDFSGGDVTFASGVNLGTAEVIKQGSGSLTLTGAGVMSAFTLQAGSVNVTHATALGSGLVTVDGGSLRVNAAVSNAIDVNNGGTLGGVGSVTLGNVNVAQGGTVSPGNSPDTLYGINMTLAGGSTFIWEVRNRTQAAGTGYDFLSLSGNLDLTGASASNKIILKLVSLNASDLVGNAQNFANNLTGAGYIASFDFAQVGGLNLAGGANINDVFSIDTSDFRYSDGSSSAAGLWSLSYDGSGAITLTAVPEPSTYGFALGALALAAAAVRRRRKTQPKA